MCSVAAVTLVTAMVSTAAAVDQGETQNAIAKGNARVLEKQADNAKAIGEIEADRHLQKVRAMRAQQNAIIGASNINPDTGTPADVMDQTMFFGVEDMNMIRANAARQAFGFSAQADNQLATGGLMQRAGYAKGFDTLMTGGTRAYGLYKGGQ